MKKFFNFIHHDDNFKNLIHNLVDDKNIMPDKTYNCSGLRENLSGFYQLIYSDTIEHPNKEFKKLFTVMKYFDDPNIVCEDSLELWNDEMKSCEVSIETFFNR